uniref:Uncharacterized protein n=1 Tax=Vibrio tasmaniensis TaxID=212663 RepID=B8YG35_9VIBR|nr:unknown [Vibrio tasmaniensis]
MKTIEITNVMELETNDQLLYTVSDAFTAAQYAVIYYGDNGFDNHIDGALNSCSHYSTWKGAMPSSTPLALSSYQKKYPNFDSVAVDTQINNLNIKPGHGQYLFHGGLWTHGTNKKIVTTRQLSTSLCPNIALNNALHLGKAHDAGQIDLMVMKVDNPTTNAFVFKNKGTNLGHEKEVLFSSGATLYEVGRQLITSNFVVGKAGHSNKNVCVYLVEMRLS